MRFIKPSIKGAIGLLLRSDLSILGRFGTLVLALKYCLSAATVKLQQILEQNDIVAGLKNGQYKGGEMSVLPSHLKYAVSHEWAYVDSDGLVVVGITDFAQSALGDVMSVNLPEVGDDVSAGDDMAMIESVKTASDIHAPVSGEVVAVNEALADSPELINDEPYDGGWLLKIAPNDVSELDDLMDADDYQAEIDG